MNVGGRKLDKHTKNTSLKVFALLLTFLVMFFQALRFHPTIGTGTAASHRNDVRAGSIPIVVEDDTRVLDCPLFCNEKRIDDCGREGDSTEDAMAREATENYKRHVTDGTKVPLLPVGLSVRYKERGARKWQYQPAAISGVAVDGSTGDVTYSVSGAPVSAVRPKERVMVPTNDLARLWLPYRDVGLRWDKLGVVIKASEMSDLREIVGEIGDEEQDEKVEYLQGVKELFEPEGLYKYVMHIASATPGFAAIVSQDYCAALAREIKDVGWKGAGWWRKDLWDVPAWEMAEMLG